MLKYHAPTQTFFVKPTYYHQFKDKAEFEWHKDEQVWITQDFQAAAVLRSIASEEAERLFKRFLLVQKPWHKPLPEAPSGLTYKPHQDEATRFALERNRSYLALDPGTGKTPVAVRVAQALYPRPIIYTTPPFLVENIKREFKLWAPELSVKMLREPGLANVTILPDTLLSAESTLNYLGLKKNQPIHGTLIIDEAHRFKSHTAKRTKALLGNKRSRGLVDYFSHHIFMSGTPMPNRPMELHPILSRMVPDRIDWMNRYEFGMKYCNGHYDGDGKLNFNGASNTKELGARIKGSFMLRIKKDVLDLPPKVEEVFILSDTMKGEVKALNHSIIKHIQADENDPNYGSVVINNVQLNRFEHHMATYRRILGVEKAKLIIPYIKDLLEESTESILVFAYHKEAVAILEKELKAYNPFVITGDTPIGDRQRYVNEFQESSTRKLFVGNYSAMGVGFTLTKATRAIFVEFDWVPGVNEQAADRIHRIGQNKSVLVQYVTFPESIDAAVITAILNKRASIQHV